MKQIIAAAFGLVLLADCAGTRTTDALPDAAASPPTTGEAAPSGTAPLPAGASKSAQAPGKADARPPDRLVRTDLTAGTGAAAKKGQRLRVHYVGKLTNGSTFDTSVGRQPFTFTLGGGQVIKGWDEGLVGMKVGGKRRLVIPPDLGYGASGVPPTIPPNATLVFEIELLGIE
jgi:peptidylprolyl isomerase